MARTLVNAPSRRWHLPKAARCLGSLALTLSAACSAQNHVVALAPASPAELARAGYGWPPGSPAGSSDGGAHLSTTATADPARVAAKTTPPPGVALPSARPRLPESSFIPGGDGCLRELDALGVTYDRLEAKQGIATPIRAKLSLGGIEYHSRAGLPFIMDCRLAVALTRIAPILRENGVSDVYFSGAYVYRMSRVGRLSYHAYGLAIDIHELDVHGERLSVEKHFARGLGCRSSVPGLNRLACELKRTGIFKELLTPDYNADHHDHFHFGIEPLRQDSAGS